MDLVRHEGVYDFFVAAATVAAPSTHSFSPQAVANLLWAFSKAKVAREEGAILRFAKAAALDSQRRANKFAWQSLSVVLSSLQRLGLSLEPEVRSLAILLVTWAIACSPKMGTQALLNIAQSAVRMRVQPGLLKIFVAQLKMIFLDREDRLNDIDRRQWNEVQEYARDRGWDAVRVRSSRMKRRCVRNMGEKEFGASFQGLSRGLQ